MRILDGAAIIVTKGEMLATATSTEPNRSTAAAVVCFETNRPILLLFAAAAITIGGQQLVV